MGEVVEVIHTIESPLLVLMNPQLFFSADLPLVAVRDGGKNLSLDRSYLFNHRVAKLMPQIEKQVRVHGAILFTPMGVGNKNEKVIVIKNYVRLATGEEETPQDLKVSSTIDFFHLYTQFSPDGSFPLTSSTSFTSPPSSLSVLKGHPQKRLKSFPLSTHQWVSREKEREGEGIGGASSIPGPINGRE